MKLLKRMKCSLWTDIDQPENEMSEKQNKAQNKMYNKLAFNYQKKKREREGKRAVSWRIHKTWWQGVPLRAGVASVKSNPVTQGKRKRETDISLHTLFEWCSTCTYCLKHYKNLKSFSYAFFCLSCLFSNSQQICT